MRKFTLIILAVLLVASLISIPIEAYMLIWGVGSRHLMLKLLGTSTITMLLTGVLGASMSKD